MPETMLRNTGQATYGEFTVLVSVNTSIVVGGFLYYLKWHRALMTKKKADHSKRPNAYLEKGKMQEVGMPIVHVRLTLDAIHGEPGKAFELWPSEERHNEAERLGGPAEGRQIEDITLNDVLYSHPEDHLRYQQQRLGFITEHHDCSAPAQSSPRHAGPSTVIRTSTTIAAATAVQVLDNASLLQVVKRCWRLVTRSSRRRRFNVQYKRVHQLNIKRHSSGNSGEYVTIRRASLEDGTFFKFVPATNEIDDNAFDLARTEMGENDRVLDFLSSMRSSLDAMHVMVRQLASDPP